MKSKYTFGCPVTNIYASIDNPFRNCFYVQKIGNIIRCTDGKGKFGSFNKDAIHTGHLDDDAVEKLRFEVC